MGEESEIGTATIEEPKSRTARIREGAVKAKDTAARFSRNLLFGNMLSSNIFYRHKFTVIIIMSLLIAFITLKFENQINMEKIAKYERELAIAKSEAIRERSLYRSSTRESMMQQRIDSLHLGLQTQTQPPFQLKYSK